MKDNWTFGKRIAAGFAVAALVTARTPARAIVGTWPLAFWLFAGCQLVGELRPIKWLRRREGGEVTATWAFAFALFGGMVANSWLRPAGRHPR